MVTNTIFKIAVGNTSNAKKVTKLTFAMPMINPET